MGWDTPSGVCSVMPFGSVGSGASAVSRRSASAVSASVNSRVVVHHSTRMWFGSRQ